VFGGVVDLQPRQQAAGFLGGNASYKEPPTWVLRLSSTSRILGAWGS
jgi:hypothetical protein